jgi:DNA-binding SARP family transcriptional activator
LIEFGILGPLVVRADGEPLALRGPRQRSLLALLLIHGDRVVSADRIADLLWHGDPPASAPNTLQAHVGRLRRSLGSAGVCLVTRPSGYVLQLGGAELDARRFEEELGAARRAAADGRFIQAEAAFWSALELWRGPALVEFSNEGFATAEAARLDELRVDATDGWAAAALARGRGAEMVASLEALVTEYPLRERFVAHLMVALYRAGRQADALAAYRAARLRLRDELGIDPGRELQQLEEAVLLQKPELDGAAPAGVGHRLPRGAQVSGPPFVGRVADLAWLDTAWRRARRGEGGLALVRGEPGVGKTRLAATWAGRCHEEGTIVLWGRCREEPMIAFQPVAEALAPLAAHGPAVAALGTPGDDGALRGEPDVERYRMFSATAAVVAEAATTGPMLVVLDDLHWADRPTLALIDHLVRALHGSPVLLLATARTTEATAAEALASFVTELRQDGMATARVLDGLGGHEVTELIAAVAGGATPAPFSEAVTARTDGNPFFVTELLRHLEEVSGGYAFASADPADLDRLGVPDGVRAVVGRRLARLSPATGEVLDVAATIGSMVDVDVVLATVGGDRAVVAAALDEAEAAGLLVAPVAADRPYTFAHALVREAVYASLGTARRALLHHRVGDALESLRASEDDARLAQLAHHFAQASTAADIDKAIVYAQRAGETAMIALAYEEAVARLDLALDLLARSAQAVDRGRRADLLLARGLALFASDERSRAKADFEETAAIVERLRDGGRLARVALSVTGTTMRHLWADYGTTSEWTVRLLEEALDWIGPADSSTRARLLARLVEEQYFADSAETRTTLADEAIAVARRLEDRRALADALQSRLRALWRPENAAGRLAIADELVQVASAGGEAEQVMSGHALRIALRLELVLHENIDDEIATYAQLAADYRSPYHQVWSRAILAGRALCRGDFARTEQLIDEGMVVAPEVFGYAVQGFAGQLCTLRIEQGRAGEVLSAAADFVEQFAQAPAWRAGLSVIMAELGLRHEARAEMHRLVGGGAGGLRRDHEWLFVMGALAETCSLLGDASVSADIYGLLAPFADRCVVMGEGYVLWCSAEKSLGILALGAGRFAEACGHLHRALAVHQALGAAPLEARTSFEYARALAGVGAAPAEIEHRLAHAKGIAVELGQHGLLRRIDEFELQGR